MTLLSGSSLRSKITAVLVLTSAATLLLATMALFALEVSEFRESITQEMRSVASAVGANSKAALEFGDQEAGIETLEAFSEDPRVVSAALYDKEGKLFASYSTSQATKPIPTRFDLVESELSGEEIVIRLPVMHNGQQIGSIFLHAAAADIYERLYQHLIISLGILVISLIVAFVLSSHLGEVISRPIASLAETVRRVSAENNYNLRAVKMSNDETGVLVTQFNTMMEEIGRQTKAIEDSERQLRLITDSLPVLIAYVDADGRYQFNNFAYERWYGQPKEWFKGRNVGEVIDRDAYQRFAPNIQKVLSGQSATFEATAEYPSVGLRSINATLVPDLASDKTVRGFFVLIADVTDRKKIEDELRMLNELLEERVEERTHALEESQERLRQSERLASIGTLAAGVAHEIRNPLNSILLATQFAQRYRSELQPEISTIFSSITAEAKRCATIIRNILVFAKSEKTEKLAHDLNQVVRHASDLARSYLNHSKTEIALHLYDGELPAVLNSTEIEQVLINLINNAAEAQPDGVHISISTEAVGELARVCVSDDGPGIPEKILRHIFDPFFSTKRQKGNTGLGLSLSHGIIADHGGNLSVESAVGKGTTFCIELPRVIA